MKILFVTSYPLEYSASSNVRNLGLIEGFMAEGHEVYTYSPFPTDLSLFSGKLLSLNFKERYWIGGPKNINLPKESKKRSISQFVKSWLFQSYNYFIIYDRRQLLRKKVDASQFPERFDVVISSSDPKSAHLFVEELFRKNKNFADKWIQYWGDPFSGDISYHRFFGAIRVSREEKRIISKADKVVYVSPFTSDLLKKTYPEFLNKIEFYPIPYRLSKAPKQTFSFDGFEPVVGYMGDYHSSIRNLQPLYDALCETKVKAYIIGNSDLNLSSTERISVSGRVNGEELGKISESINIITCVCNNHGTQIPGKVYHYVNLGKPILVIVDGEYSQELIEYFKGFDRFYICNNNKESIQKTLELIIQEKKSFGVPDKLNPQKIASRILS